MTQAHAKVRRWGSSLAAVIPPDVLRAEGISEGDEVVLEVRKARRLRDLFGLIADRPIDAQSVKNETRREERD